MNLVKEDKYPYTEKYKMLVKKVKDVDIQKNTSCVRKTPRNTQKGATNSMQFLSKFQLHFSQNQKKGTSRSYIVTKDP